MRSKQKGNILISLALTGGILLFIASFINAGLRTMTPEDNGAVRGAYIAQRVTTGPSPTNAPAARVTSTPEPSPFMRVNIKNTQGSPVALSGGTVCSGSWGGQIRAGATTTGNCEYTPTASFTIPFDQYKYYGTYSGAYVIMPGGWSITGATTDYTYGFTSVASATDERSHTGSLYGWPVGDIYTGQRVLNLTVQPPPSYGYILQGKTILRVSYYPGQAATTVCGNVTPIQTCGGYPIVSAANSVSHCSIPPNTSYAIFSTTSCPSPTVLPTAVPTATPLPTNTPTVVPTKVPTGISPKPTCTQDCALQQKGDADCSLNIDSTDYTYWKIKYLGAEMPPELLVMRRKIDPDFDHNGKINLVDLQIWQDGLNSPPPTPAGACTAPTAEVKPTETKPTAAPTLGPGCYYKQVQCIKAPCPPIVVCPSATPRVENDLSPTKPQAMPQATNCKPIYSADSPWNTPIASNPQLEGSVTVNTLTTYGGDFGSDPTQFTVPIYPVDSTTPATTVTVSGKYSNVTSSTTLLSEKGAISLKAPANAVQSTGSDAEIVFWNQTTGDEYGFWKSIKNSDGTWSATNGYHYNTNWTGAPPAGFGSRGSGTPYMSGIVRKCEIEQGHIDHALALVVPHSSCDTYVYPATKTDGDGSKADIPEGARLQLDPSLTDAQIQAWGCTGSCLIIAKAMQKYGMYNIDVGGHAKIYVEDEHSAQWNGLITSKTVKPIPYTAMRILKLGNLISNGKTCI